MLDHKTGNHVDLILEPAGDGKKKLVRLLKAAEVVFLKYATGKPFPLGP